MMEKILRWLSLENVRILLLTKNINLNYLC